MADLSTAVLSAASRRTRAVVLAWVLLAGLVFVFSFGGGWPYSLAAIVIASVLLLSAPTKAVILASALAAIAFGAYLVTLIPGSIGSELTTGILALSAFAVGLLIYGLLSRDIHRD